MTRGPSYRYHPTMTSKALTTAMIVLAACLRVLPAHGADTATGLHIVGADPNVRIIIDADEPLRLARGLTLEVPAGWYHIEAVRPGFFPYWTDVQVADGTVVEVPIPALERKPGIPIEAVAVGAVAVGFSLLLAGGVGVAEYYSASKGPPHNQ